jgi:hypothetical protein
MKGCLGITAMLATAFSALMFLVFFVQVLMGADNLVLLALMALLFGLITAASGLYSVRFIKDFFGNRELGAEQEEHRILSLASHKGGRLTVEEVSIHCHIPIEQSKRILDNMVRKNTADTWISDNGAMVYVFRGLLDTDDKHSAEDPFASL